MAAKILTVISYGSEKGNSVRFTIQPSSIQFVTAPEAMVQLNEMSLYRATVRFLEGSSGTRQVELYVNREDLNKLEEAVGFYGMENEFSDVS